VTETAKPPGAPAQPGAGSGPEPPAKPGRIATARAGVSKAQDRAQDIYQRLQAARETNNLVDTGFHFHERDLGAGGGVLAGALAFRLFIFAVPYAFVIISVFGSVADLQNESGQDAARSAGLTGLIGKSIADAQRQTDSTKVLSIILGIFALFWAARAVVKTLRAVSALAWRVPLTRLKRPTAAAGILIGTILAASVVSTLIGKLRAERPLIGVLFGVSAIIVWAGAWLFVSWLLPKAKGVTWRDLVPGSLLFGLVVWVMHLLTVFYFSRKISNASETYGAIGSAIGILLALYLFGRAMSAAATLNATLWERKQLETAQARATGKPR
jgi:uncharacterized BrkB/YihY/UPF0761 family membrane protein